MCYLEKHGRGEGFAEPINIIVGKKSVRHAGGRCDAEDGQDLEEIGDEELEPGTASVRMAVQW